MCVVGEQDQQSKHWSGWLSWGEPPTAEHQPAAAGPTGPEPREAPAHSEPTTTTTEHHQTTAEGQREVRFEFYLWKYIVCITITTTLQKGGLQECNRWSILVPQRTFQWTVLKIKCFSLCEEQLKKSKEPFFHYKELFVEWKDSMNVKGSSWNQKNLQF